MKINEGNIFEAMRLVLPEHRAVMNLVTKEMSKRERPALTEDEYVQMQYVLAEALELERCVRVQLFRPYEDKVIMGVPSLKGNKLYLQTVAGYIELKSSDIVRIEMFDSDDR